ncbi:MAG: hypothetical protein ACLVJ6_11980 [Merdibacter sp.]
MLKLTLLFEGVGALLSFIVFVQDYPPMDALHRIVPFCGGVQQLWLDVLGGLQNWIRIKMMSCSIW